MSDVIIGDQCRICLGHVYKHIGSYALVHRDCLDGKPRGGISYHERTASILAARNAALEEAAREVDAVHPSSDAAARIRALKTKP